MAAQKNNLNIGRLLIQYQADVNVQDVSGETPLHDAARSGAFEFTKELLSCGAKKAVKNKSDETPAMIAFNSGHMKLYELLK